MKHKHTMTEVLLRVIRQARLLSGALLLIIIASIVFALFPPLVLQQCIDRLTEGNEVAFTLAAAYFLTLVLSGLSDAAKEVLITVFGQRVTRELRHEMCGKLSYLPASYFTKMESGRITTRFVNNVDAVETLFTNGIISMVVDCCKVVSILVMIFIMSKGLGIMMVLVTPVLFYMTRHFQKRMLKAQIANRIAIGKVNNHVPETIHNIRMVHTFGKEAYMERRYDSYIQESYKAVEKSNFYDAIYSPIILIISAVMVAIMMVLSASGGWMEAFFGMSVGTAVAIIAYVGKVFEPLESIGMEIENVQSAVAGIKRIDEFMQEPEQEGKDDTIDVTSMIRDCEKNEPCIRLENVAFTYEPGKPVLEDLSLQIACGENVTLAGRTGAGKSTVFRLIAGMYPPDQGEVTIFGVPANQIPDTKKDRLFGYVEQSFSMVPGTIADQITLYDSSITVEQVKKAARLAGIDEKIASLQDGYDTVCSKNLFSQGELQLLSIARAIVREPKILLLDEMTANLDAKTEQKVLAAIENASKNRTVLSISHRIYEHTKRGRLVYIE